jgi:hypothetical protein
MIAGLEKVYPIIAHQIDEPMFLGESPRPYAGALIFQRFRFAKTSKGVTHNRFNQFKGAEGNFSLGFDPIAEVFSKFWLKDGIALARTIIRSR